MREPDGFREFLAARQSTLLRAAWLLTGDAHLAEDLLQTALVKVLPRWERLARDGAVEAYLRKTMVTTATSWWRRKWHGEVPSGHLPGPAAGRTSWEPANGILTSDGGFEAVDDRSVLAAALRSLPPRQRAVVMLRYYLDMSEAETAALLGCSNGTVKSQSSKALATLRTRLSRTQRAQEVSV
ncbi:RNA polymerase sigma-70 factor (sigma-E family) [Catenulispora sp. GAS73]|uniref:SigE family RNA polymerase sigma factor n=1 Tax=Catenulispora sp. GAS73 TaxID=3156269 RepID=UPI003519D0E9